jgi:hypothetical protein
MRLVALIAATCAAIALDISVHADRLQSFVDQSLQGSWSPDFELWEMWGGTLDEDSSAEAAEAAAATFDARDRDAWLWLDESGKTWRLDDYGDSAWASGLRVVFYGSSHLRELHYEIVRWHLGLPIGMGNAERMNIKNEDSVAFASSATDLKDDLPREVKMVGCRSCNESRGDCAGCDNRRFGRPLDGVDMEVCGLPGYRVVEELSDTVAIGFKTYIHTPLTEALLIERLHRDGLQKPDVLVLDCGVWGARGGLGFDETDGKELYHYKLPTFRDEVEYFVSWVHTQFPDSLVLWVYGFCELASSTFTSLETCMGIQRSLVDAIENFRQLGRAVGADVLVNKSRIAGWGSHDGREAAIPGLRYVRPVAMRCGHGCRGPALRVLSKIIKLVIDKHESGLHTPMEAM